MTQQQYKIFLACLPGLEAVLADEARAVGLPDPVAVAGGVETSGDMHMIWRANLWLRGASRVLVRIGEFRAMHLAQLDKRAEISLGGFLACGCSGQGGRHLHAVENLPQGGCRAACGTSDS